MNELLIKVGKGAALGLVGAIAFDVQKWNEQSGTAFDWKIALPRWVKGAVTGALGALGVSA
jgi:hypothetical protein